MPKRKNIQKILIIGSGPIIIGQACEFDYSGVQACKALRDEGYQTVLVNSNPATIMTDPEMANRRNARISSAADFSLLRAVVNLGQFPAECSTRAVRPVVAGCRSVSPSRLGACHISRP